MRIRRWSELTRVERVSLYTRQSLYLVLWGMSLVGVLAASPMMDARGATMVVVGGVVVTALGSVTLSAVMAIYPATHPFPGWRAGVLVAAGVVYLVLAALVAGSTAQGAAAVVVAGSLGVGLGGLPDRRVTAGLVVICGLAGGLSGGWAGLASSAAIAAFLVFTVRASLWLYGIVTELDAARHIQAQLAVAEERLRFSRDVHDVLGRHLSTIAVQAELAATLARRGDERAAAQMMDVRQVAHDALAEARELARGYRPTSFPQEVEGARSLLRSAGIEVRLEIGVVPRAWHEAAGWVVRESVTNVLRHSSAHRVRISYADGTLRVSNDGVAAGAERTPGSGLRELTERLAQLGAVVTAGIVDDEWVVEARLPGSGPLGALNAPSRRSV